MPARLTLDEFQKIAEKNGGRCLSTEYINNRKDLTFECAEGHVWSATGVSIKNSESWCPYCSGNAKPSIEFFQNLAVSHDGRCLSTKYINKKEKLEFECSEGHVWSTLAGNVKKGSWCPYCAGNIKLSIEDYQKKAEEQGGRCLSTEYIRANRKLEFECPKGHRWEASGSNIKNAGSWCPECSHAAKRLPLAEFHEIAAKHNGRCLSTVYVNKETDLEFECSEGHRWETAGGNVKNSGSWCPYCAGSAKLSLEDFQKKAEEQGGRCLSIEYIGIKKKLEFECSQGHIWKAYGAHVKKGHWCPYCAGVGKLSLEEFQKIAKERGGRCLSTEYKSSKSKLEFECSEGHTWMASGGMVKNAGNWCPDCASGRGEKEALSFASKVSGLSFNKTRPKWLRSSQGGRMEIDGYCKSTSLAVEYQGRQHYEYIPKFFHRDGIEGFVLQQERDRLKAELVAARGILLLAVPASRKSDPASVRAAVVKAAEDACFPLLGVNREFTEMCVRMGRPPMHRFSACLPYAAFRACVGE